MSPQMGCAAGAAQPYAHSRLGCHERAQIETPLPSKATRTLDAGTWEATIVARAGGLMKKRTLD